MPLTARGPVSAAVGAGDARYSVHRRGGGLGAANEAHGLRIVFGTEAVVVSAGGNRLGLTLRAVGRGQALRAVAPAVPHAQANRVEYRRAGLVEWYANGPLGLEQGFTLARSPAGGSEPLTLEIELTGSLARAARGDRRSVLFGNLAYRGLIVTDARGQTVPAWLELRGRELRIRVDDRTARYPLLVDPFIQQAKLTASDGAPIANLGSSVAVSGDTIAVGAPQAQVSGQYTGAVYVFVKPAGGWAGATETAKLTASDGTGGDGLGHGVAIDGDTIVGAAPFADISGPGGDEGAVYVFVKPGGGWASGTQTAKLTASDGDVGDSLGNYAVGVSGDTIAVGAVGATVGGNDQQGAVYVFVEPGGGWAAGTETAKLTASDGAANDGLGAGVAVSGDTVVAGAPNSNATKGAVYVFVEPGGGWADGTQAAKLTASGAVANDNLGAGSGVAIDGDTVAAGAATATVGPNMEQGAVYVFVKPGGGWADGTQTAKLTASDGGPFVNLGRGVDVSGDTVVAGEPNTSSSKGAVYVFVKPGAGWADGTETQKLTASDGANFDRLGNFAVGIDGTTIAAGAAGAKIGTNSGQGAAYVFATSMATITVRKTLVPASDAGRFDLIVGTTTVKAAAGDGGSGSASVEAGTYTVRELPAVGTSIADYTSSIACTLNGGPGPSGSGTTRSVTVAGGDVLDCTITNTQRKARITLTKSLFPATDPGRFDLRVNQMVVKAAAGDGEGGSALVVPGKYTLSEELVFHQGLDERDYESMIACTLNGAPGPSGMGGVLKVTVVTADALDCTVTNLQKKRVTLIKSLVPSTDPGRFNLTLDGAVVKAQAGDGDSGSRSIIDPIGRGRHTVGETASEGTNLNDYVTIISCVTDGKHAEVVPDTEVVLGVVREPVVCTFTNFRKGAIRVTKVLKHSDPGRFDLKVGSTVVKAAAGDGDSGSTIAGPGTFVVSEVAAPGTDLSNYKSEISCTRNGFDRSGPEGKRGGKSERRTAKGSSMSVTLGPDDVVDCTITNSRLGRP